MESPAARTDRGPARNRSNSKPGIAFGERKPELVQRVARSLLEQLGDDGAQFDVGDVVQFPRPDGEPGFAGVVREIGRRVAAVRLQPPAGRPARDVRSQSDRGALMATTDLLTEVALAEPRGFCAGVDRAIEIVERALRRFGAPIYVRHEIVHNTYVVNDLKAKGAIFIEDLADVPPRCHAGVQRPRRADGGARRGAAARLSGVRRHLPAGHQGAHRGGQAGARGLRVRDDRPQGPPRGRGHDGPAERGHLPGRRRGRRGRRAAARRQARGGDTNHAVGGRRGRDPGRA